MNDITVIIPYYNEIKTLPRTLNLISTQTLMPKEVLLVHSTSTDGSDHLVDEWIKENQPKFLTRFKNVSEDSYLPSESKNIGIRMATTEWLAFMDCSLLFERDWLEKQMKFAEKHAVDIVYGRGFFSGTNLVDRCCIAHTYGYKTYNENGMTPSSLMKRSVFDRAGLFAKRRAGYDIAWRRHVRELSISSMVNPEVTIFYNGVNFAPTLKRAFLKSILYAAASVNIPHFATPYYYLMALLVSIFAVWIDPAFLLPMIILYILFRGYVIPFKKAKQLSLIREDFRAIFLLPITAFVLDAGRMIGFLKGMYLHHLKVAK